MMSDEMKKIELTVREIDVAKFEKGSNYLILIDPASPLVSSIQAIENLIWKKLGVKVLALPMEQRHMKIYGLPTERILNKEVFPASEQSGDEADEVGKV